jgi:hypothetical protein
MKFTIPILLLLFTSCQERKKEIRELDVIDTQMAEVRGPVKIKREDSITLLRTFDLFYKALETEDGVLLAQLNTENNKWPSSLNDILDIPVYLPKFLITAPVQRLYNKELWTTLNNKKLNIKIHATGSSGDSTINQQDSIVSLFTISFKSKKNTYKSDFKKVTAEREYSFEFIKTGNSFKFNRYDSYELSWRDYPSIDSIKAYFPKSGLPKLHGARKDFLSNFRNIWYSSVLEGCSEPVLYDYQGEDEVYRFTWLRSFNTPVIIKIQKHHFDFMFTAKELSPVYKEFPQELNISDTGFISWFKWYTFKSKLDKISFWNMPMDDTEEQGMDGARWVLEGVKDGQYHFIDRWSAKGSDFGKACLYLIKISNLEIGDEDIY